MIVMPEIIFECFAGGGGAVEEYAKGWDDDTVVAEILARRATVESADRALPTAGEHLATNGRRGLCGARIGYRSSYIIRRYPDTASAVAAACGRCRRAVARHGADHVPPPRPKRGPATITFRDVVLHDDDLIVRPNGERSYLRNVVRYGGGIRATREALADGRLTVAELRANLRGRALPERFSVGPTERYAPWSDPT